MAWGQRRVWSHTDLSSNLASAEQFEPMSDPCSLGFSVYQRPPPHGIAENEVRLHVKCLARCFGHSKCLTEGILDALFILVVPRARVKSESPGLDVRVAVCPLAPHGDVWVSWCSGVTPSVPCPGSWLRFSQ